MSDVDIGAEASDARFLAQERILDALLRSLAMEQPSLLSTIKCILVDTEFTHSGKPGGDQNVHEQIRQRIDMASMFASDHGAGQS